MNKFYTITNNNQVVCSADHVLICIPQIYFKDKLASWMGEKISTIGLLYVEVFPTSSSKTSEIFKLNIPVNVYVNFSEQFTLMKKFPGMDEEETFEVFRVNKNEVIMDSVNHIMSIFSTKAFLDFLEKGKIPEDSDYSDVLGMFQENASLNGISLGVPSVLLEAIVGEMTRNPNDLYEPFRIRAGTFGKTTGYKTMRLKDLPKFSSVFSAMAFENITDSLRAGTIMTKLDKEQKQPPIEEAIYY